MARRNNNRLLQPQARQAMDSFKMEVASELGISNYASVDKGDLPSRINGKIGGNMVKKMIAQAESALAGGSASMSTGMNTGTTGGTVSVTAETTGLTSTTNITGGNS